MTPENISARALELGADDALIFRIDQIVFDSRTLLKCMYGCEDWGKGHTCPSAPGSLKPWEYERILKGYEWGCIVHSTSKKVSQDISFALEREAFLAGHYFAFSMSDCAICQECAGFKGKPCIAPGRARPAFHSVGIDVFATVKQFDLPLSTLKSEDDEQNWYSAVFVA
jgi:predicted metal-binding protein